MLTQKSGQSPLGVRPFESYRFAGVPFVLRLAAAPAVAKVSAAVQTVLKIGEDQQSLESRVTFDVRERPVYQFQMLLPEGFRLDQLDIEGLAPGELPIRHHPARRPRAADDLHGRGPAGRDGGGDSRPTCRRRLGAQGPRRELPLPRLEVLGVERQQGDVAVEVDPDFDVEAADTGELRTGVAGPARPAGSSPSKCGSPAWPCTTAAFPIPARCG